MAVETACDEIINRFQDADRLLVELRSQASALQAAVGVLAGHDKSLATIAENSGAILSDVAGLGGTLNSVRSDLIATLESASKTMRTVKAQAEALDAERIAGQINDSLDDLRRSVMAQFEDLTSQLDRDLTRLDKLAAAIEGRLRFFEPDRFLSDVDDRVASMSDQISRLTAAAASLDQLLEKSIRGDHLRPLSKGNLLSQKVALRAYVVLLVLVLFSLVK